MFGMLETYKNAFKVPELRMKLIFTFIIIVLYRLGAAVPVPYIDSARMQELFASQGDTIFGYLNILSGDAFSKATLFALSISPYITSSIVMQLLTIAIPYLENLQKEEEGKKKITQITRYITVVLGLITGYGYYVTCRNYGLVKDTGLFAGIVIVACYSAGSALIMWLGEKINENGIGNGISMILFANIVSRIPSAAASQVYGIYNDIVNKTATASSVIFDALRLTVILAVAIVIVAFVVFMSNAERRFPIQYAKRQVGRKMYGGQNTYLPLKVNMSGVMPIIFASSMVSIPITVIRLIDSNPTGFLKTLGDILGTRSPVYILLEFAMIIAFSYFYIAISFNPIQVSNQLKENGGFIPGIRPGKPTAEYITKTLNKVVFIGGLFLGLIAVFPLIINAVASTINNAWGLGAIAFGGTSLLIVVGVALETTKELESHLDLRNFNTRSNRSKGLW